MLMTLIIAFVSVINLFIILNLQPDYIDRMLALAQQSMLNKGMPQEQIDMGMKYAKMFTTPGMLYLFTIIGSLIGGAVFGLIATGLTTKKKPLFDDANEEVLNNEIPQE